MISTKLKCKICIPVLKMILTLKQNTHIVCFHNCLSFFMLIQSYVYMDFWYKKRFLNVDWFNENTLKCTHFTRNFNCKRTVINIACMSPTSKNDSTFKNQMFFFWFCIKNSSHSWLASQFKQNVFLKHNCPR